MNQGKNIEELFKERLLEYEITPPAWSTFDQKYQKYLKKKRTTQLIAGSTIIVTTLAIIGLLLSRPEKKPHIQPAITSLTTSETISQYPKKDKTVKFSRPSSAPKSNPHTTQAQTTTSTTPQHKNIAKAPNTNTPQKTTSTIPAISSPSDSTPPISELPPPSNTTNSFSYHIDAFTGCAPFTTTIHISSNNLKEVFAFLGNQTIDLTQNQEITIQKPGTYFITLNVKFKDNTTAQYQVATPLTVYPKPQAQIRFIDNSFVEINTTACKKTDVILDNATSYGNRNHIDVSDLIPGHHNLSVIVTNKGCSDTIHTEFFKKEPITLFMPNVFTPNGDGMNDEFKPVFNKMPESYKLIIFDKLGKVVFVSTDPAKGWKGQNAIPGLYVWKVIYTNESGKNIEKNGNVTLLKN